MSNNIVYEAPVPRGRLTASSDGEHVTITRVFEDVEVTEQVAVRVSDLEAILAAIKAAAA